ncbi:UNVERIFIED_ORG: site-specific recombinase XerD [Bacillus sp. 1751]|nr:site-specific recombinase XerD [Bacillus sp. 1751]
MLLKFAIQEFIEEKKFNNLSKNTVNTYSATLKDFQHFCSEKEIINAEEVREVTVKAFLIYCQEVRGNNVVSRNTKLHHLKIFFNYLQNEEVITDKQNPVRKMKLAKEEIKIEAFTDEHIKQMLGYFRRLKNRDKSFYAYRDHTIIVFLLSTGSRVGELVNVKWKDVDLVNHSITLFGKARKQQSIPITEKLVKELCEYKLFAEKEIGKSTDYVFTSRAGKQMTTNSVKLIFKRLKTIMNFKDVRLSAHTFRHTFAHRCLMAGMDIFTLQKLLRHGDLRMCERYLSIWGTALKEQNDKYNPLNNIEI